MAPSRKQPSRASTGNSNNRPLEALGTNTSTNRSDHERQYRRPPDSRPSTPSSNSHGPWPSPGQLSSSGNAIHSRTRSTIDISPCNSRTSWPSPSEHSLSRQQRFAPGPYRGSFDTTSTQSSSVKTKLSDMWSRFSEATSFTSLSSGRSRAKAPKLDLDIPNHSLSLGTILDNPLGGRQKFGNMPDLYDNTPQHQRAGPSNVDRVQPILPLTAETSQSTHINSANDFLHDLSPIEQAMQSRHRIYHAEAGAVLSGTLEGLVDYLIVGFGLPGHILYRDTFLTACSELTTPEDLFQILSRRLSEEEHASDEGSSIQYTIFMVIVYWLSSDCFSPNEELLYRIKFFCEEAIRRYPPLGSIAKETRHLINLKVARPEPVRASIPHEPIIRASDITPRDLAIALGLLEGDHYKALQPSDYLQHLSKGHSDRVKLYIKTNEKIKLWVIKSILYYDTAKNRSEVVTFYINTAFECYSMRNFSSTAAISSALQSVSVENLRATMKATKKALSKKVQAKLPAIYDIVHPHSNHRGYHEAFQSAETTQELDTCIPWLPVHLKELDKVVRQSLTIKVDDQHLVNFSRHNRFMDRIKEILYYTPPNLEDKRHGGQLTYLLNRLDEIDLSGDLEQQLLAKSEMFSNRESSSNNIDENLRLVGFKIP